MPQRRLGRIWLAYAAAVVLLAAAAALARGWNPFLAIFSAWGLLLGWAALRIAAAAPARPILWLAAAVVGWHALFGPAMLLYILTRGAMRNDDLVLRLYPHVIAWINSFE